MNFQVGQKYQGVRSGVTLSPLSSDGSILTIAPESTCGPMSDLSGRVVSKILVRNTAILTLWQFGGRQWLAAPVNTRAIADSDDICLENIPAKLVVNAIVVDQRTGLITNCRTFSIGADKTSALVDAMRQQILFKCELMNETFDNFNQHSPSYWVNEIKTNRQV